MYSFGHKLLFFIFKLNHTNLSFESQLLNIFKYCSEDHTTKHSRLFQEHKKGLILNLVEIIVELNNNQNRS